MKCRTTCRSSLPALLLVSLLSTYRVVAADANLGLSESNSGVLQEIVVTAQKRNERLQDVPVSVGTIEASSMVEQHVVQVADYLGQVPGLAANVDDQGSVTLAIRGITTGAGGGNPTVGVTIDDVPFGASAGLSSGTVPELDPGVLQRVEVLRGPQGTLYGASSMGGLLKYVTVPPDLRNTHGQWEVDGLTVDGGGNGYSVRGSVSTPVVTDLFAVTASAFYRRDPGYVNNTFLHESDVNSADNYGGRLAGLWQINDAASLQLAALYQHTTGDGSSHVELDNTAHPINGLTNNQIAGAGPYDLSLQLYSANLNIDFGWGALTSVTSYGSYIQHSTSDVTQSLPYFATGPGTGLLFSEPAYTHKVSEEIRLASSVNQPLTWVAGLFYTSEKSPLEAIITEIDPATGAVIDTTLTDPVHENSYREYAGFADLTYKFTEEFDLQVGGRYGANRQNYYETYTSPIIGSYDSGHLQSEDHSVTYLFTPRWKLSKELMSYLRIASGYRPGGPNPGGGIGFPATFGADTTKSYELGLKGETLGGKLRFDADVYYIDWNKIQLKQIVPSGPFQGFEYFGNGGKAKSQGVEFDVTAIPLRDLSITATLGYTDATLTQDIPGGVIFADSGDRLPYSAKWTASLDTEQKFPLTARAQGFVGATARYVGQRFSDFPNNPPPAVERLSMPSYTLLDLRAGVRVDDWNFSLFAQNVTDRLAVLSIAPQDGLGFSGINNGVVQRPRTIGIAVSKSY